MIHLIIAKREIISIAALLGNMVVLAVMCASTSLYVVAFIHSICPNPNNVYLGHCEIDQDGNEDHGNENNNESFESVLSHSVHGDINFAGGEKVKIWISFENNKFPIANVREFVSRSPVDGWQVTFVGYTLTDAMILCLSAEMCCEAFV